MSSIPFRHDARTALNVEGGRRRRKRKDEEKNKSIKEKEKEGEKIRKRE